MIYADEFLAVDTDQWCDWPQPTELVVLGSWGYSSKMAIHWTVKLQCVVFLTCCAISRISELNIHSERSMGTHTVEVTQVLKSLETSGVHCKPTMFMKNTFRAITCHNLAKYSYPHLVLTNTICYPEGKVSLMRQGPAQRDLSQLTSGLGTVSSSLTSSSSAQSQHCISPTIPPVWSIRPSGLILNVGSMTGPMGTSMDLQVKRGLSSMQP